jgi:hypothetical protein
MTPLNAEAEPLLEPEPPIPHTRHNFAVLVLDVSFFSLGMALLEPSAVLPLLMENLGASGVLIGLFAALRSLGLNVVQIFVAYATHNRRRQLPPLLYAATLTRLPLLVMPLFLWHAGDSETARNAAKWAVVLLMSLWALGDGLGYVPWMEIVARAFNQRTRGRFFATTQMLSGIGSIVIAGFLTSRILDPKFLPFPKNYAILAALSVLMFHISLVGVYLIKEPPASPNFNSAPRPPLTAYFRRLPVLLRENPVFLRLAIVQLLASFGTAASSFYVLYAKARFGTSDQWGGIYQIMQAASVVLLSPLWTWISEKRGPAIAVRAVVLAHLLTPIAALTIGGISPIAFCLVYLLMGGSLGWGMWIAASHYLLSNVSEDERPIFVALVNLLVAPSAIYPILGGLFVVNKSVYLWNGVPILFVLTACVIAVGYALARTLPNK